MCGFVGYVGRFGTATEVLAPMLGAIAHRGPDDEGVWSDEIAAMGHRRLSIIDLSERGAQPMQSRCGRYVIVFNGEVYNYKELRSQLDLTGDADWSSSSDTEVLVEALTQWGLDVALTKVNGMFAFALWDRVDLQLVLARDRFGEKPLYYSLQDSGLVFASELSAIEKLRGVSLAVDPSALSEYLRVGYFPAPCTIYANAKKIRPAHYVRYTYRSEIKETCYWDLLDVVRRGHDQRHTGTEMAAIEEAEDLIRDSVRLRLRADVPVGAFLSGGTDSGLVSALMAHESSRAMTFSIGFETTEYNEAPHARALAERLGTTHTEKYVSPSDALQSISELMPSLDEPIADSSLIPTHLVSQLARERVKVCLTGDGGDEMFAGYKRYDAAREVWRAIGSVPRGARRLSACVLNRLPLSVLRTLLSPAQVLAARYGRPGDMGHKARRLSTWVGASSFYDLYERMMSLWPDHRALVRGLTEESTRQATPEGAGEAESLLEWMVYRDMSDYLPGDILTKVDRATMGVGLEGRLPLLDHRIAEFSARLPDRLKSRDGTGKWILKQVAHRHLPHQVTKRSKLGFAMPISEWLRGPLLPWASDLLDQSKIERDGMLNAEIVGKAWSEHTSGEHDHSQALWAVLALQAWLEQRV